MFSLIQKIHLIGECHISLVAYCGLLFFVLQTRADFVAEHSTAVDDDGQLNEELVVFFFFVIV